MAVKVAPSQLYVYPVLAGLMRVCVIALSYTRGFGNTLFALKNQGYISTRELELVTLSWMNVLLLYSLNLKVIRDLVKHLAKIHDQTLMNFLPKMSPENLNQIDL